MEVDSDQDHLASVKVSDKLLIAAAIGNKEYLYRDAGRQTAIYPASQLGHEAACCCTSFTERTKSMDAQGMRHICCRGPSNLNCTARMSVLRQAVMSPWNASSSSPTST